MLNTETALAPNRGMHVLVVDDVLMNRDIVGSLLRAAGHRVLCVEGGAEAVAAAGSMDFDVVLMDVRMPEMDGLEATRRIRMLEGARGRVPIVALTSQAFTEQALSYRDSGMNSHLVTPFEVDALFTAVARATAPGLRHGEQVRTLLTTVEKMVPIGARLPLITASTDVDPDFAIFNSARFGVNTRSLPPEDVKAQMRKLIARSETLLRGLRTPGILAGAGELAEPAHLLAGGAGMFGFLFLADAACRFEFAADAGMPETEALADQLATAIDAAVTIMRGIVVDVPAAGT